MVNLQTTDKGNNMLVDANGNRIGPPNPEVDQLQVVTNKVCELVNNLNEMAQTVNSQSDMLKMQQKVIAVLVDKVTALEVKP